MALCGYGGVEAARETLKPEREAAVSEVQKAVIAQLTGGGAEPRLGDETIIEGLLEKVRVRVRVRVRARVRVRVTLTLTLRRQAASTLSREPQTPLVRVRVRVRV